MSQNSRLYLDHAATTPMVDAARDAMAEAAKTWANPSSPHREGRDARAKLEKARTQIGTALNWDGEIIFTSGASEAIAIGLRGTQPKVSAVEHDAVLAMADKADLLTVNSVGLVDTAHIQGNGIYAIQSVNNETGVIQPLDDIAFEVRDVGGILFADCSQSAGKMPLPDADLISISAHKFGGPPGIGALLARNLGLLSPSGGQEQGYRRGTENLPAIMAMAAALEAGFGWMDNATILRTELENAIMKAGGAVVAADSPRIATIGCYHMPGVSASSQLIGFDMAGISVSAGSACSSGTLKTSHVLGAMGWDAQAAGEVVRVSFGPTTNEAGIKRFVATWLAIAERAKAA